MDPCSKSHSNGIAFPQLKALPVVAIARALNLYNISDRIPKPQNHIFFLQKPSQIILLVSNAGYCEIWVMEVFYGEVADLKGSSNFHGPSTQNFDSIYVSIYPSMYLCIYVSMYLCMYVCIYLSIYLSTYPSTYPSIYLSIYLSSSSSTSQICYS